MTYKISWVTVSWTEHMFTLHVLLELIVSLFIFHTCDPMIDVIMEPSRVLWVNPTCFSGTVRQIFLVIPITRANISLKIYWRWFGSFILKGCIILENFIYHFQLTNRKSTMFIWLFRVKTEQGFIFFFSYPSEVFEAYFYQQKTGSSATFQPWGVGNFEPPAVYVWLVSFILDKWCKTTWFHMISAEVSFF